MSSSFTGFSEEDIHKLKSGKPLNEDVNKSITKIGKKNEKKSILKNKTPKTNKINTNVAFDLPENAKLSIKKESKEILKNIESETYEEKDVKNTENTVTVNVSKVEKKVINLDEFQAKQKMMEEQNRKRKELLGKALADRTKRTEDEAQRLKEIQNEFKKLDDILSNDVSILRHQIEVASIEFMEAQKRYHKVEKEFLEVKLTLHQKLERKEMLTEHLCAIIEKNEERKADKLSELMNKLSASEGSLQKVDSEEIVSNTNENNNEEVKNNGAHNNDNNLQDDKVTENCDESQK